MDAACLMQPGLVTEAVPMLRVFLFEVVHVLVNCGSGEGLELVELYSI